ncbi:nuclear transport factor 2 family protein [Algoriphagus sediminis]|uniref:Nuclear transport factor 2 family protein n=1 Tax=Algoriphagus sediminis TaxID=3057113 RepID=A0ABT7Y8G4_9BACT|nr:nuclear transport factor 2 family protein [Algoriphagus sediminis]MDN3202803.1 nuclear transport factor 2 family protein [Algoriphagus sediminis]
MKLFFITLLLFSNGYLFAQSNCLTEKNLLQTDLDWEQALLKADTAFLNGLLAKDFVWVHNHASLIDSKSDVLKRAAAQLANGSDNTRSRISDEVKVFIFGNTAVVNGYTMVDRGPKPTKYNFMRTYTEVEGKCYLLSNHTMAIPDDE